MVIQIQCRESMKMQHKRYGPSSRCTNNIVLQQMYAADFVVVLDTTGEMFEISKRKLGFKIFLGQR